MKFKRVFLFQEDDAAPDAWDSFDKRLKEETGLALKEFKEQGTYYNYSDSMEWYYKNYVLSIYADDPFYLLEQIVEDSTHG